MQIQFSDRNNCDLLVFKAFYVSYYTFTQCERFSLYIYLYILYVASYVQGVS